MDNQHKLITGYRDLAEHEIRTINALKLIEGDLDRLLTSIGAEVTGPAPARWLSLARTNLEQGLMWAIKAIARPEGGLGNPVRPEEQLDAALGESDGEEVGREEAAERRYREAFEAKAAEMQAKHEARHAELDREHEATMQQRARMPEPEQRDPVELTRDGRVKLTDEQIAAERLERGFDPYVNPGAKAEYERQVAANKALEEEHRRDAEQAAQKAAGTYQTPRDPLEMPAEDLSEAYRQELERIEAKLTAEQEREARLAEAEMNRPRTPEEYKQLATPTTPSGKMEGPEPKPPGEPNATFGSGGARPRFVIPEGTLRDNRGEFVPTPDNPDDDPMSNAGRPPKGETDRDWPF